MDVTNAGEILVVEDTPASLTLLADMLKRAGYTVREAPNGELALWSAQARAPDLILLDVRMPGIDGYEVCRRLKQSPELRDVPVVFLSAQSDVDDKLRGFQAGGIDYIGKPFQAEEVLARTRAHIALARSQRALAASNDSLAAALAELQAARAELRRSEQLAALGAIVAGVAHELNTPIGNCVLAASALEERARSFAQEAAQGVRRSALDNFVADTREVSVMLQRNLAVSAELIASFKQIATDQAGSVRRRFALASLVRDTCRTLAPQVQGAMASIVFDLDEAIAMDSFPGALAEVISKLVGNALVHGFRDGRVGQITIRATGEGERVRLSVCDNGAGIAEADLGRIFDPFFTTHMGEGSGGLGLHIVHNLIINVLGATIAASSSDGQTCFVIDCPRRAPCLPSAHALPE